MKNCKYVNTLFCAGCLFGAAGIAAGQTEGDSGAETRPGGSAAESSAASPPERDAGAEETPGSDVPGIGPLLESLRFRSGEVDWRGKRFNLGGAEMAQARFEKYLNSPPSTSEDDLGYDELLRKITRRLIGEGGGSDRKRVSEAWRMLYKAAEYPMDAGLSEVLADRVVSFWQTNRKVARLELQSERMESDRDYRESKIRSIGDRDRREFIDLTRGVEAQDSPPPPSLDHLSDPERRRLEEIEEKLEENERFEATSRITQKLEFQSLIVQFFVQRRFEHALIANYFYRYIFEAEEDELEGSEALRSQVFGELDVKITTSTLGTMAKEAIGDAESRLKSADYHLEQGELHSATKRLMEAFQLGEYLPEIKRYPLGKKRRIAGYLRDLMRVASALEVKSFDRAEEKLREIGAYAADFDGAQAEAYIRTSRQLSNLAVQRAMGAAREEDSAAVEAAVREAVRHWPNNPAIGKFSNALLEKTDLRDVAASDFDRFLRQKDHRAIFNDRFRFAAALAADPERNDAFMEIMERMEVIESAMAQAEELKRIGNSHAAWEVLERVYRKHADDQELNRMRGDYAVRASEFAAVVARAEDALAGGNASKALFAFLDAGRMNPGSYFAERGIESAVETILSDRRPESADDVAAEVAEAE